MLQIKNLIKTYKPKKGAPVRAVDGISLTFPDTGMVFLLGRSGSGKSTLLNLLGGLDKEDSGEIIINSVSTKNFTQKNLDSYRNTCVGFIFQEYNLLDEFTVGANIALAIELQGRRAENDEINKILDEVELTGFGDRKPNELSGGQKQRVAIARALVKNPEIIMADEPTGALDSNTGIAVFELLRKLSETRLVLIVSHDRRFAEEYGDRIIELCDGHIIGDCVRAEKYDFSKENSVKLDDTPGEENISFLRNTITVAQGYRLTESDRIKINNYLESIENGGIVFEQMNNDPQPTYSSEFVDTVPEVADAPVQSNGHRFSLIKSKLPLHSAVKIGASGLKYKKVRLVFTVLLSCVAFTMFAFSDIFSAYNNIKTASASIIDTGVNYASFNKSKKITDETGYTYTYSDIRLKEDEIAEIGKRTGLSLHGSYMPPSAMLLLTNLGDNSENDILSIITDFNGFVEINEDVLKDTGSKLVAGKLPDGNKNEVAISTLAFERYKASYYVPDGDGEKEKIKSHDDMLGKTIYLCGTEYTVSAIVDTGIDLDRYKKLIDTSEHVVESQMLVNYFLSSELEYAVKYSLAGSAMVGNGKIDGIRASLNGIASTCVSGLSFYTSDNDSNKNFDYGFDAFSLITLSNAGNLNIAWLDGKKDYLSDKEIIVSSDMIFDAQTKYSTDEMEKNQIAAEKYKGLSLTLTSFDTYGSGYTETDGYKIVGYFEAPEDSLYGQLIIASETFFKEYADTSEYTFTVGKMPENKSDIAKLLRLSSEPDSDGISYIMKNAVTYELDTVDSALKVLSKVFAYIGLAFALFAMLLFSNFIATSISHKKREIGILRGIGSRSTDVFRIFLSESFIIAAAIFVITSLFTFGLANALNGYIRQSIGFYVTIANFSLRQVGLVLLLSAAVAIVASFIPVYRIASKRPIDAIHNK